jgi:hypothetical protein
MSSIKSSRSTPERRYVGGIYTDSLQRTSRVSSFNGGPTSTAAKRRAVIHSPSLATPLITASGLGLHLVDRAAELPIEQMDMHEPWRSLHSLGPYDHLRRLYRVCKVHNYRNIRICAVTEPVRQLMRSLACIRHPDWDGTIAQILASGGKAGTGKRPMRRPLQA